MNQLRRVRVGGRVAVEKRYAPVDTLRFKCFGSGAANESLLGPLLGRLIPSVLHHAVELDDTERVLVEWCAGETRTTALLTADDAVAAGRLLARIHGVGHPTYGSLDGRFAWFSHAESFSRRWRHGVRLLHARDAGLARRVDRWAVERLTALRPSKPVLVHGDFGPTNLVWTRGDPPVRALDWEHAHYGDAGEDWAKIDLARRFPEPNGFGDEPTIIGALERGYADKAGCSRPAPEPTYEVYYAMVLGHYFDCADRLAWLGEQTR